MNIIKLTKEQNEFLGGIVAIAVENNAQFLKLKEFMSIKNLFLRDGSPVSKLELNVTEPIAFFRNYVSSHIVYGTLLEAERDYKVLKYNDVFAEQINFFGNEGLLSKTDDDLIVKQREEKTLEEKIMEVEVKEVENEVSLVEIINTLEIDEVTPASITENITVNKDKLLQAVKQRSNIIVTKDNFNEMKVVRADLNKKKDYLVEQRVKVKKAAASKIDEFIESITEVVKAIEGIISPMDADIKKYEAEAKEELKKKIVERDIKPLLDAGVAAKYFTQEVADMFVFDSSWTNASALTSTGALTAKTKNAINEEMNRLITLYNQQQNDIQTIESSVKQLAEAYQLDVVPGHQVYVDHYKNGMAMPAVQQKITDDIKMIKNAAEKQAQKIVSQQQTSAPSQNVPIEENQPHMPSDGAIVDDKTGEVLGKFNGKQLLTEMAVAPDGYEDKEFNYTYLFSGPCAIIMTLNKFLKILSKINPKFKYEKVGK